MERRTDLTAVARYVTIAWLVSSAAEFTVWLFICVIGWDLVHPFWIYTVGLGGVIVAILRWFAAMTMGSRS